MKVKAAKILKTSRSGGEEWHQRLAARVARAAAAAASNIAYLVAAKKRVSVGVNIAAAHVTSTRAYIMPSGIVYQRGIAKNIENIQAVRQSA